MKVYTDASTHPTKGISGLAFIVTDSKNRRIFKNAAIVQEKDNNTAELRAICFALAKLKNTKEPIILLTDSTYSVNAIRTGVCRESEKKLLGYIQKYIKMINCKVFWIKGHAQDKTILSFYNKEADKAAKKVRKVYEIEQIKLKKKKAKLAWKNNKLIKSNDR